MTEETDATVEFDCKTYVNGQEKGMPPSLSMSRGRNNMYFPCGGPGMEPPHVQRGHCFPMSDEKIGGMPPGMACGMMGEFKSPLIEPPTPPVGNSKKKRRTSAAVTPQPSPVLQDLMPQQPSTLGDTIVASNPFDDTPPSSSVSMMPHHMHMGAPMGMSPMHSPHMNIGPPMSSPMNNMGMVGNPLSSPLGSPHMMGMMNGGAPHMMVSPAMSPMSMMNNNPMTSPHAASPIMGSPHIGMNGPLGSPMNCSGPTPSPNSCSVNAPCSGPCPSVSAGAPGPANNCMTMTNCSPCSPSVPCGPSCGPRMPMGPRMMGPPHPSGPGPAPMSHMHMLGMAPKPLPVSAGKVYPPDQPMVFNPQNPNAPPIYPCGICHKEVHDNDQAILCESGCNFWFHRMCTGLSEPAYQLLTAEVYAEWVCDKCLNSKNIPLVKFKP